MSFEDAIQKTMFNTDNDRSFIDKLLAKEENNEFREIVKKERLSREDLSVLLSLMIGIEAKLVNYSSDDRYIVNKFFVWIREFIKVAEEVYDYDAHLKKIAKTKEYELSERTIKIYDDFKRRIEHEVKFLIDVYLNIARTSLSIGATGILELLKNKFEFAYAQEGLSTPVKERGGMFKK